MTGDIHRVHREALFYVGVRHECQVRINRGGGTGDFRRAGAVPEFSTAVASRPETSALSRRYTHMFWGWNQNL
jgi:hypothetical protein